ncbi:MAG: GxxExxY protein [Patescibacteria group bacterium]
MSDKPFVYEEVSYRIIGCLYDVYNQLGSGLKEQVYQKAVGLKLSNDGFSFKEQVYVPIMYNGLRVGYRYLDLLVDGKIILELKSGSLFSRQNMDQTNEYLKLTGLQLAILANFSSNGVKIKRLVNLP